VTKIVPLPISGPEQFTQLSTAANCLHDCIERYTWDRWRLRRVKFVGVHYCSLNSLKLRRDVRWPQVEYIKAATFLVIIIIIISADLLECIENLICFFGTINHH